MGRDWNDTHGYSNPDDLIQDARVIVPLAEKTSARKPNGHSHGQDFQLPQAAPFVWVEPEEILRRKWLYGTHYCRGFVSVTVAPGGMGKTLLGVVEALAKVTGRPLLGERVHEPCLVWLWNGEDPYDELQRRIVAACRHYSIKPEEIAGRLFVNSGLDTPIVIVRETREGLRIAEPVVDALIDTIRANRIDAFIVDPFVVTHQVNENSNVAIDLAGRVWAQIASQTNTACGLFHHVRKGGTGQAEFTVEDGRGASALIAVARSARVMNRMTDDEGHKAGVENHRRFFRIDNGKANLAPPADQTSWHEIVSHTLPNGDNVGVVTEWEWPDPLEGRTVQELFNVQKAIDGKGYRASVQANDWVGRPIADVLGLDVDADREKIKSMIAIWQKTGALKVAELKDAKGKPRPVVAVGRWVNA
jgi:hypothetical protein